MSKLSPGATVGVSIDYWPNERQPGVSPGDISILDVSTNRRYNSYCCTFGDGYGPKHGLKFGQRFAASYVTGSHSVKIGFQQEEGVRDFSLEHNGSQGWTFNGLTPTSITQTATPYRE